MNESNKDYTVNVQGFELTVTTPSVVVSHNVDQLVDYIKERVKDYSVEKYEGNAEAAKKDRTELNKGAEQVKSIRQSIQSFNPYGDLITKLSQAEKLIKSGSDALGEIVHAKEAEEKDAKRALIQTVWDTHKFVLFQLDKVLNPKWLNKTYKMTDIQNEIDVVIDRTYRDIKTIESVAGPHIEAVKAKYLADLDLSAALEYGEQLEKNVKAAQEELDSRAEREHNERIEAQKKEVLEETDRYAHRERVTDLVADALGDDSMPPLRRYTITVSVTEPLLIGIKDFLTSQGVEYECHELEF